MCDWIELSQNFNSTPNIDPELIYRKEPLNYTQELNLTNLIPFLLPKYSAVYMRNANLSDYYSHIDYYSYSKRITFLYSYLYIGGSAKYNLDGVLEEISLNSWITGKSEPALWLTRVSSGASGGEIPDGDDDDDDDKKTNPFIVFIISPIGLILIISIFSAIAIFGISLWYFKHKKTIQVKKDIEKKFSQSSSSNT